MVELNAKFRFEFTLSYILNKTNFLLPFLDFLDHIMAHILVNSAIKSKHHLLKLLLCVRRYSKGCVF